MILSFSAGPLAQTECPAHGRAFIFLNSQVRVTLGEKQNRHCPQCCAAQLMTGVGQNEPCHSRRRHSRSTSVSGPAGRRSALPGRADIVAKRFLALERRTVFSRLDRIGNFDSQNRPFGFYYCRISLAGPFLGDFCNNIGQEETWSAICAADRNPGVIVTDRDAWTALAGDGASGEPHRDRSILMPERANRAA